MVAIHYARRFRLCTFLIVMFWIGTVSGYADHTVQIFSPGDAGPATMSVLHAPTVLRARAVDLDPRTLTRISVGDRIEAPAFQDAVARATVDRVLMDVNGTLRIRARLDDDPYGFILLTRHNDQVVGVIEEPSRQRTFAIRPFPDHFHAHTVEEVDPFKADVLACGTCTDVCEHTQTARVDGSPFEFNPETVTQSSGGAEIDVMIVYTPAARDWANSWAGGINSAIAQSMERAQLVVDNSGVDLTFNLVHSALVDYQESGDAWTDLQRLRNASLPQFVQVHAWRDEFGADLVAMFTLENLVGGMAYQLDWRPGAQDNGFSITRIQQAHNTYTHIHEMGHNLGLHHRKDQVHQPGPTEWWAGSWPENTWSAGWRWIGNNGTRYCSVMSYNETWGGQSVFTVAHFSSPQINFQGQPTGHAQDGDNVRTLRETKHTVAAYRAAVSRTLRIMGNMHFGELAGGQSSQRTLTLNNDGTETITVTGTVWPEGFAGSWTGSIPAGQSQTVTVTFNPASPKFHVGAVEVLSDATGGNRWHTLSGYGVSATAQALDIAYPVPGTSVPQTTETVSLSGTAGNDLVGHFRWTNSLTGQTGLIPASTAWTVNSVPLQTGTNWIHVRGTNQPPPTVRASDSAALAAYSSGWSNGQNGGFGLRPWEMTVYGSNGGFFRGGSAIGSQAWGLWANAGETGLDDSTAVAVRPLLQHLVPTNTFLVKFQNKWILDNRSVGIALQNADGEFLFEFLFIGGRQHYIINDRIAGRQTSISYTGDGLNLAFDLTGPDTYRLRVGPQSIAGELAQRNDMRIGQFRAWNFSAGPGSNYDFFINDLAVTNTPISASTAMAETWVVRQEAPKLNVQTDPETGFLLSWPDGLADAVDLYRSTNLLLPNSGFFPYITNMPVGQNIHTITVHEVEGPAYYRLQTR